MLSVLLFSGTLKYSGRMIVFSNNLYTLQNLVRLKEGFIV